MTRNSFAAAMAAGLLFSVIATMDGAVAQATEIKVLTSVALTSALDELAPQFERATGNKLNIGYGLIADIRKRIIAGETADVVILSRPAMDDLQKQDKIAEYRRELFQFVYQRPADLQGRDRTLSEQAYASTLSHLAARRLPKFNRSGLVFVLALLMLLGLSELLWLWQSWPVRAALATTV